MAATVTIDSGEFPLIRNIDPKHQPSRSRVYAAWSKAFNSQVPWALNAVVDVIDDVYRFELWKDKRLETPQEFFDQIGLGELNLEEPARAIAAIRALPATATREDAVRATHEIRRETIIKLDADGKNQCEIAAEVGVTQGRVSQVLAKPARAEKTNKGPRVQIRVEIYSGTQPENAARRIREKFGEDYARVLGKTLIKGE